MPCETVPPGHAREDGRRGFLHLQKERCAIGGGEEAERAERADGADPHDLERDVTQSVAVDEVPPLRRQGRPILRESLGGAQRLAALYALYPMEDVGCLVGDPPFGWRFALAVCRETLKVAAVFRTFHSFGHERVDGFAQGGVVDMRHEFARIRAQAPDLQRRQERQFGHTGAIGVRGAVRSVARLLHLGLSPFENRQRHAGTEPFNVDGEIDVRQSLVEIIDLEQGLALGARADPKIADVAVAAGLNREPPARCPAQILGHHGRGAPEEAVRRRTHAPIAFRYEVGKTAAVGFGQNRKRIAPDREGELGKALAWRAVSQRFAEVIPHFVRRGSGGRWGVGRHENPIVQKSPRAI